MLVAVIAGAEVAFWIVLGLGLLVRYGLRLHRLGGALLLAVPLVDLALLAATVLDLRRGGEASAAHGLAAVYLGVSIGYGHQIMRRLDAWAAYRFRGGPRPVRPEKGTRERARHELAQFGRHVIAWAAGCGLLLLGIWYVGDAGRTEALLATTRLWTLILVIDGAVSLYDAARYARAGSGARS